MSVIQLATLLEFVETSQFTDEQLIGLHQHNQSGEGFTIIYQRYVQRIHQKCLIIVGNSEDANDVVQDVFLKVFEKPNAFQYRSSFSTWLHSVAHNKCVDTVRRKECFKTETLSNRLSEQLLEEWPESNDKYKLKMRLLGQLPEEDLLLLRLKYEHGLSIKELSQRFQVKECAIKMRLKRSRDRLRMLYSEYHQSNT